jgi:hypothetical protein
MKKAKNPARKAPMGLKTAPRLSIRSIAICSNRETLESKLKKHKMSKAQSVDFLIRAMGNPAISYCGKKPNLNERYEVVVGAYISGGWKRNYSSWKQGEN